MCALDSFCVNEIVMQHSTNSRLLIELLSCKFDRTKVARSRYRHRDAQRPLDDLMEMVRNALDTRRSSILNRGPTE